MTTAPDLPAHGVQSTEDRLRISLRMIIQAREELKMGSRLQAGEKAWGAVVHPVKAIAEQRGWRHKSHQDVHAALSQVVLEYGFDSDQVQALSEAYRVGHENFYENFRSPEELSEMIDGVERVMEALIDVTAMPPRPLTITSSTQLRRLRRLTNNEALEIGDTSDVGFSLNHGTVDPSEA